MVTITDARVTPDLRDATLYYTVYGDEAARADSAAALDSARGVLRSQVGRQTGIKFTPTLAFVPDVGARAGRAHRRAARGGPGRRRRAGPGPAGRDATPAIPTRTSTSTTTWTRPTTPTRSDRGGLGLARPGSLPTRDRAPAARPRRSGTRRSRRSRPTAARWSSPATSARTPTPSAACSRWRTRCAGAAPGCCRRSARRSSWPDSLAGLPGVDLLVPPGAVPAAPALLVTLDTGSADRLGSLAPLVDSAAEVLVVDHHASNTRYGTLHLVDPAAAATAVLVEELVRRLDVELDAGHRRLPVRGAGHRHRLVPVRLDHAGDARAGGPAAAHRDPARPDHPPAARHPPGRLARHGRRRARPGPAGAGRGRRRSAWSGPTPGWPSWPPPGSAPTRRRA